MELWFQVIVEWVNCLDIIDTNVKELKDLEDGIFYRKLLKLLSWEDDKDILDDESLIAKFIQDEYPQFKFGSENDTSQREQIYIASLFLLYTSQKPIFHRPMCSKLQHETQIKIKTFLEMIIPYGSNITKEIIKEVIAELEDVAPKTPMTPRTRALKDFFSSPASRSMQSHKIMTERNRELRQLKSELEMERFEKADLQEDLRIQQCKIQNLQKKLQEKTMELKALRDERMRPATPQSCKKNKGTYDFEQHYKKEIDRLEDQLMQRQCEIEKLETTNEALSKRIACIDRQRILLRDKLENCEKSLENLQVQGVVKDRELVNLRMTNEELRTHLKELNKTSAAEQSFEIDGIMALHSPLPSLNNSEALSSVIDIQLQEAKEESASLKSQLDTLSKRLQSVVEEHQKTMCLNTELRDKASMLEDTQIELTATREKLFSTNKDIETLQKEKSSLIDENKKLEDLYESQKSTLLQFEETKNVLNLEVDNLNQKMRELKESLFTETETTSKLNDELSKAQSHISNNLECIQNLTDENTSCKVTIECCNKNLKEIIRQTAYEENIENNNLDDTQTIQLIEYLERILANLQQNCALKESEVKILKEKLEETNSELSRQRSKIFEFEEKDKQQLTQMFNLRNELDMTTVKISELAENVRVSSEEIVRLREIEAQKEILDEDLHKLKEEMTDTESLLKSLQIRVTELEDERTTLTKELHLKETEYLQQLDKCQKENAETVEKMYNDYEQLRQNFDEEHLRRKNLEATIDENMKELTTVRNALETNILEGQQTTNALKSELSEFRIKLEQSAQEVERLNKVKEALEEGHKNLIDEKNQSLDNLKAENTKISVELKSITDQYNTLQQEISNLSIQIKSKNEQVENLLSETTSLRLEKEHLIHLQQEGESKSKLFIEQLETRLLDKQRSYDQLSIETKLKEERLELLQSKFERLTKDTVASELKMKEVIMNLQEVRSNQDAVLTAQEKALKEKCSHLEELHKEFSESKSTLCKQLENEKILRDNLQKTCSELETQSYKQTKRIEELEELLKKERNELDAKREYCKTEDTKKLEIAKVCEKLELSINDLKSTIVEAVPDTDLYGTISSDQFSTSSDNRSKDILSIVQCTINEVQASRKLISHLLNTNETLNKTLRDQKITIDSYVKNSEDIQMLKSKIQEMQSTERKNMKHFNHLIKHKESLRDSLQSIMKSREGLDSSLSTLKERWNTVLTTFGNIFVIDKSVCDELKHIQARKAELENTLSKYDIYHLENMKPLNAILWQKFLWTEQKLGNVYSHFTNNQHTMEIFVDTAENSFADEKTIIDAELQKNKTLQRDIAQTEIEIEDFSNSVALFEINFKSDQSRQLSEVEKNLQLQINELTKEKSDVEDKLDTLRIRNTKLEGHVVELRNKLKELKEETVPLIEHDALKKEITELKDENSKLREERDELNKRPKPEDVDNQLKDVHNKYEIKLNEIKQKMKTAYNEQIAKMNIEQEKCIQQRLESLHEKMEQQCRKQADEICKYKAHVSEMSSQFWTVGEKLLTAQQQKQELQKELNELKAKLQNMKLELNQHQMIAATEHKTSRYEKKDFLPADSNEEVFHKIAVIQERTTYERRCSIRSIQTMGNAFNAEDEEEVFDNTYLADMKEGQPSINVDTDRLSILKKRNALCKPHLKSSYPAEMQFHPLPFTEEEIKAGSVSEEVFNDSLSQSLLPEQKTKKKDRTQTSYKKPGPPTPSKNGGRLSLQGNELRSPNSRILREKNKDRATATPRTIKSLFSSKRQDENVIGTPRGRRRSSIFRKYRVTSDKRGE